MCRRVILYFFAVLTAAGSGCKKSGNFSLTEQLPLEQKQDSTLALQEPDSNGTAFLALGDSYTIGASVGEEERFPFQTKALLEANGKTISSLNYIAFSGWTTTRLQNAINDQKPPDSFGIVTILIGVNDQYQGSELDIAGYRSRFVGLLEKSIQLTGGRRTRVFVLSIPDYSVTPFAAGGNTERIRAEIEGFNQVNKEVAEAYSVNYTDITPISRAAKDDLTLLASDGLHPSGKMYQKWAELLEPQIRAVLP
ncbi:MAG TPA: SGNH/GDSL hydrolase family protein [Agriterribacter sp.]|nr:SGNH/GDSL hydrolase family protein [Agriterribacter sp.]